MKSYQNSFNEFQYYITPSDMIEFLYCKRFIYYMKCLGIKQYEDKRYKVEKGRELHRKKENENKDYLRKKLGVVDKKINIDLYSDKYKIKGKVDRTQISKLCEEYGYKGDFERVVQISTVLKDADALDRERFGTRGKLNPEYLRTDSAKSRKMVLFAQKVNGIYAKKMIDRNYEVNGQVNKFNAVKILQSKRKENSR